MINIHTDTRTVPGRHLSHAVAQHLRTTSPNRVFLQYSPLSEWEVIGRQLSMHGFERKSRAHYGRDPDAPTKRRYIRGRDFPYYGHMLDLWVPNP